MQRSKHMKVKIVSHFSQLYQTGTETWKHSRN